MRLSRSVRFSLSGVNLGILRLPILLVLLLPNILVARPVFAVMFALFVPCRGLF